MASTPSERTIENLSNHAILEILNFGKGAPPYAWFCLPTQVEEGFLGYDADLAGSKRLYIQYKRMSGLGDFRFSLRQLWVMCAHLQRYAKPYVLLAGNVAADYAALSDFHNPPAGSRHKAFDHTFFVDAWVTLEDACEAVFGSPINLPPLLPIPPPPGTDLGYVTLKGDPTVGPFILDLSTSTHVFGGITALLAAVGAAPVAPIWPAAAFANIVGFGQEVVDAVAGCHVGRPVADSDPGELAAMKRKFEESDEVSKNVLRRLSVLAAPIPQTK